MCIRDIHRIAELIGCGLDIGHDVKDTRFLNYKKYIRYIADRRLISMGMRGIFKVKRNPLLCVEEMINAPTHTNFFENRATDYARGALQGDWGDVWGVASV